MSHQYIPLVVNIFRYKTFFLSSYQEYFQQIFDHFFQKFREHIQQKHQKQIKEKSTNDEEKVPESSFQPEDETNLLLEKFEKIRQEALRQYHKQMSKYLDKIFIEFLCRDDVIAKLDIFSKYEIQDEIIEQIDELAKPIQEKFHQDLRNFCQMVQQTKDNKENHFEQLKVEIQEKIEHLERNRNQLKVRFRNATNSIVMKNLINDSDSMDLDTTND